MYLGETFMIKILKKMQPTLVVNGNNIEKQIEELKFLFEKLNETGRNILENDIKLLQIGLSGENKILYELLNSTIPMYIFHDVYYEFDELSAQIDFVIVTAYKIFIVECKNVIGNVIVNSDGNFIREYNGKREGMYSSFTQNDRHIDVILNMMYSRKGFLGKLFFDKTIKRHIESLIVFVNPKTIIKKQYAPKNIKSRVLRADEINAYIKKAINLCEFKNLDMESFSNFFKQNNIIRNINYVSKYEKYFINKSYLKEKAINTEEDLRSALKKYRMNKSISKNTKPYYIFTNEQLDSIIHNLPKTKEELLKVAGFGEYKVSEFGDDIIALVIKYIN